MATRKTKRKSSTSSGTRKVAGTRKVTKRKSTAGAKGAATRKSAASKVTGKKVPAKKVTTKKVATKKAAGKKSVGKKSAAKSAPAKGVSSTAVNLGNVFSLRPRVSKSFRQGDFLTARRLLEEESYATLEEATRAVALRALELSNNPGSKLGTKRGRGASGA